MKKLLKPLAYLRIQHREKDNFDYILPGLLTLVAILIIHYMPKHITILGDKSLIKVITGIMQILSGFYIASLAAIATFNLPGMDDPMAGKPPRLLVVNEYGRRSVLRLSRRRFLCFLFGYLAFMGLFLYFVGECMILFASNVSLLTPSFYLYNTLKLGFLFVYLFFTMHLLVNTLLGLYYLTDRIHWDIPKPN